MPIPLMVDELTEAQRVTLMSLKQHPGFAILEQMLMSACDRANRAVIQLDPTEEGYERKLKALQQRARERNEFCLLVLQSVEFHTEVLLKAEQELKSQPEENRIVKTPLWVLDKKDKK